MLANENVVVGRNFQHAHRLTTQSLFGLSLPELLARPCSSSRKTRPVIGQVLQVMVGHVDRCGPIDRSKLDSLDPALFDGGGIILDAKRLRIGAAMHDEPRAYFMLLPVSRRPTTNSSRCSQSGCGWAGIRDGMVWY